MVSAQGKHVHEVELEPAEQRRVAAAVVALVAQHGSLRAASLEIDVDDSVLSRLRRARPWECRCMPAALDAIATALGLTREQLLRTGVAVGESTFADR